MFCSFGVIISLWFGSDWFSIPNSDQKRAEKSIELKILNINVDKLKKTVQDQVTKTKRKERRNLMFDSKVSHKRGMSMLLSVLFSHYSINHLFTLGLLAASFHLISGTNQLHRKRSPHLPPPHSFCTCLLTPLDLTQPLHQPSLHLLNLLLVLPDPSSS